MKRHKRLFELQGHRGARGLQPENTLPSFEAALDACVTSIETDVHLTAEGIPVLVHDAMLTAGWCRPRPGASVPAQWLDEPLLASLTLAELRCLLADRNPDRQRFPDQRREVSPAAKLFAKRRGMAVYAVPTLADLFEFAAAYAGDLGEQASKTPAQRSKAARVRFDIELKRVPYHPETIGDAFDGCKAGLLEKKVVEAVRAAGVNERTAIRSFDHRAVKAARSLAREIRGCVLIAHTAPVSPSRLAQAAGADTIAIDFQFLDAGIVREAHKHGVRVVPWTVNELKDWETLLLWNVDGICTDYPDRLARLLRALAVEIE